MLEMRKLFTTHSKLPSDTKTRGQCKQTMYQVNYEHIFIINIDNENLRYKFSKPNPS